MALRSAWNERKFTSDVDMWRSDFFVWWTIGVHDESQFLTVGQES